MIRSQQRYYGLKDDLFFVECRYDHGNSRAIARIVDRVPLTPVLDDRKGPDKHQPAGAEHDTDQEQVLNCADDEINRRERRAPRPCLPPHFCGHQGHHLIARLAHQIADGDQLKPVSAQLGDQLGQRLNRLRAIASRVMQ